MKPIARLIVAAVLLTAAWDSALSQWVKLDFTCKGPIPTLFSSGNNLFVSIYDSLLRSSDNGASWKVVNNGFPAGFRGLDGLAAVGTTLVASDSWSGVFRSTDQGDNWTPVCTPLGFLNGLTVIDSTIYAQTSWGLHYSTDCGASWKQVNIGSFTSMEVSAFAVLGTNWFVGFGKDKGIWRSPDKGASWTSAYAGIPSKVTWGNLFNRIFALVPVDTTLFCGYYGYGIYRSTDYGASWTSVGPGLSNYYSNTFLSIGQTLFIGMEYSGIYYTTDGREPWNAADEGFPSSSITIQALTVQGPYIYAATCPAGGATPVTSSLWRRPLAELVTSVNERPTVGPGEFRLGQNYPNPFNPQTTISSQLPMDSRVRLAVYDLLGREVTVLVDERREAGVYQDTFDGSGLASGVYICRMTAGAFVQARAMLLVR